MRLLAHGWIYSFFWTAAAYLYLWLRHDVDGTPPDEIEPAGLGSGTIAAPDSFAHPSPAHEIPLEHRADHGTFGFEQQVIGVFFVAVRAGIRSPGRPTCRA